MPLIVPLIDFVCWSIYSIWYWLNFFERKLTALRAWLLRKHFYEQLFMKTQWHSMLARALTLSRCFGVRGSQRRVSAYFELLL